MSDQEHSWRIPRKSYTLIFKATDTDGEAVGVSFSFENQDWQQKYDEALEQHVGPNALKDGLPLEFEVPDPDDVPDGSNVTANDAAASGGKSRKITVSLLQDGEVPPDYESTIPSGTQAFSFTLLVKKRV
jgi:hypothetical protein